MPLLVLDSSLRRLQGQEVSIDLISVSSSGELFVVRQGQTEGALADRLSIRVVEGPQEGMRERLASIHPFKRIVLQQQLHEVNQQLIIGRKPFLQRDVGRLVHHASPTHHGERSLHHLKVGCRRLPDQFLDLCQHVQGGGAHDERGLEEHLAGDAPERPDVDGHRVPPGTKEQLWSAIPPRAHILRHVAGKVVGAHGRDARPAEVS
mmetsp:Transcript_51785/g.133703  ORF Transcript_51785/g.133703 Transcript_51785/m.133703 type:complete len:206 (+) Transcript_51785:235-852(+)